MSEKNLLTVSKKEAYKKKRRKSLLSLSHKSKHVHGDEMPDHEIVNENLLIILSKLKLNRDMNVQLESLDWEAKWKFVLRTREKLDLDGHPTAFIVQLRDKPSLSVLKKIKKQVERNDSAWMERFFKYGGIEAMVEVADMSQEMGEEKVLELVSSLLAEVLTQNPRAHKRVFYDQAVQRKFQGMADSVSTGSVLKSIATDYEARTHISDSSDDIESSMMTEEAWELQTTAMRDLVYNVKDTDPIIEELSKLRLHNKEKDEMISNLRFEIEKLQSALEHKSNREIYEHKKIQKRLDSMKGDNSDNYALIEACLQYIDILTRRVKSQDNVSSEGNSKSSASIFSKMKLESNDFEELNETLVQNNVSVYVPTGISFLGIRKLGSLHEVISKEGMKEKILDELSGKSRNALKIKVIELLLKNLPSESEIKKIQRFIQDSPAAELDEIDQLMIPLVEYDDLEERLKVLRFKNFFLKKTKSISKRIRILSHANSSLLGKNVRFVQFLELFVSASERFAFTIPGQLSAAKSLSEISEIGKLPVSENTNFLQTITEFIAKKNKGLLSWTEDLKSCSSAITTSYEQLKNDIDLLEIYCSEANVSKILQKNRGDTYAIELINRMKEYEKIVESYKQQYRLLVTEIESILELYGESKLSKPTDFFTIIHDMSQVISEQQSNTNQFSVSIKVQRSKSPERSERTKRKKPKRRKSSRN